ncbi:hypothetical protein DFP92_11832 [Yoonia sediminilitoris]|uniref:Uncharacterized protein n=1 Tax=Yoonia sediminilitoris TaxID=1286148 RepID=A0A2T6K774_9RHOB|nr:hypothetical protein C8N45_11812 [Yoonia sediminilitoris]RCW90087.1 hypothetical protein DFP92_11832 [Yoonia sediminilitoris]
MTSGTCDSRDICDTNNQDWALVADVAVVAAMAITLVKDGHISFAIVVSCNTYLLPKDLTNTLMTTSNDRKDDPPGVAFTYRTRTQTNRHQRTAALESRQTRVTSAPLTFRIGGLPAHSKMGCEIPPILLENNENEECYMRS